MNAEDQFYENIKKVIGLPSEPVAQTVSGFQMLEERPLERIWREAKMWVRAMCSGDVPLTFTLDQTLSLMLSFTRYMWERQERTRKAFEDRMNYTVSPLPLMMAPEVPGEPTLIRNLVAQCLGSQDVDFSKPSSEAVKTLVTAYCKLAQDHKLGGAFGCWPLEKDGKNGS